jgi:hypothetical protein
MSRTNSTDRSVRRLEDLISVGPAVQRDFELLGIRTVAQLARANPRRLYARLCRETGGRQDPCVLDVFQAAVAQARNPRLPAEKCVWWYWSGKRKARRAPR